MKYDPSRRALYFPETGDPVEDFSTNWTLDQICAELSRLAYYRFEEGDGPRLDRALTRAGFATAKTFNGTVKDVQAFGAVAPDNRIFVAFRGTQIKPKDIVVDAQFMLREWDGEGRVHRGFRDAYASLQGQIDEWLESLPTGLLVVTGHSLGAAMATLMAARHKEAELVAFGSPRVGDRAFADQFAGRAVRRYVDCTDGVAIVPPELIRYVHIQGMRYIDRFGVVRPTEPSAIEMAQDQRSANLAYAQKYAWQVWRNVLLRPGADHAPINYVSAVLGRREGL